MIPMPLRDVAMLTGGSLHAPTDGGSDPGSVTVDGPVVTDSREAGRGSLYVARVGEHADGHDFVAAARAAGAVAALASRPVAELPAVVVDDVQVAFGRLARGVLDRASDVTVVAVTGSSGKTTTKDLLAQVLGTAGETVAPVGSLNGEVGVPLTVCRIGSGTRFLVAEMGARGIGHIHYLTTIAPPDVSIVLNVGLAHVGEFGSREAIAVAKGEIVEALRPDGVAVLNADDPMVMGMAPRTRGRIVTVGLSPAADVRAEEVRLDDLGRPTFRLRLGDDAAEVRLRLSGSHHVGNALAVTAAATACGMALGDVAEALSAAEARSRWRMEIRDRPDGVTVVNDAYNANPDSMRAALGALARIAAARTEARSWAVLGEMLELGNEADSAHEEVGRLAARLGVDRLVAVGAGARRIGEGATQTASGTTVLLARDTDEAYHLLEEQLRGGDVVLLKSSRDAGLRWLGDRLVGLDVPDGARA